MKVNILFARLVLGGLFGLLLWRFFFRSSGPHVAAILGAGMVLLAYIIERMRLKRTSGGDSEAP